MTLENREELLPHQRIEPAPPRRIALEVGSVAEGLSRLLRAGEAWRDEQGYDCKDEPA
jgi:hypothetical protein